MAGGGWGWLAKGTRDAHFLHVIMMYCIDYIRTMEQHFLTWLLTTVLQKTVWRSGQIEGGQKLNPFIGEVSAIQFLSIFKFNKNNEVESKSLITKEPYCKDSDSFQFHFFNIPSAYLISIHRLHFHTKNIVALNV